MTHSGRGACARHAPMFQFEVWAGTRPPIGARQPFIASGLTFRPLATTAVDTLAWINTLPDERRSKLHAGLTAEREATALAAWHARV